jgi:hypothetical protein
MSLEMRVPPISSKMRVYPMRVPSIRVPQMSSEMKVLSMGVKFFYVGVPLMGVEFL